MKNWAFVCSFLFLAFSNVAKSQAIKFEEKSFFSKILNEERKLNIYLPDSFSAEKAYPVIYLLDGSLHEDFLHVAGLVQFFRMSYSMPPCILVGIANVDRKRDFTFPTTDEELKKSFPTTGGSEKFISFLESELMPFVEKSYRTTVTKYLIGQSLGGLLAVEIALKKPQLFSHYLITSPSLWWDNQSLLKQATTLLDQQKVKIPYVYVGVGKEGKVMENDAQSIFKKLEKGSFKSHFQYFPKENHATVLHISLYFVFKQMFA